MAASKTSVIHVKRALLVLACALLPLTGRAARRVPVFLVDVAGQSEPALQQAMRAALVRATGRPQSASDPAFATLVAQASKYVVNYQHGPRGQLQVAFNGAAVDQVITGLGRSVWGADRPFTLVVLNPMPDQADYQTDHDALEQAAEARGLPVSIMPLTVTDSGGHLLPEAGLLALVHRFGAEQLLIGQPPASTSGAAAGPGGTAPTGAVPGSGASSSSPESAPGQPVRCASPAASKAGAGSLPARSPKCDSPGSSAPPPIAAPAAAAAAVGSPPGPAAAVPAAAQWHWILVTPFMRRRFTGSVTTGIDGTVDLLAPPPAAAAGRVAEVPVRIEGVSSLTDYAHIERMLAAVPGVSRAGVSEVQGDTAVFAVQANGGAAAISGLLAGSAHFESVPAAGDALVYRYLPGAATPPPASPPAAPASATRKPPAPATRKPPPVTR